MNHIGSIIKSYRTMRNMSRSKLAEHICSGKYIYLIEKGERTPSADMLRQLSSRLGVDLFDHFQYLDCMDPIAVRKLMKQVALCRRKGDFTTLEEAAIHLPDFRSKPWAYEIEVNRIISMIFVQHRYQEAISELQAFLQRMDPQYRETVHMANMYVLFSTSYQNTGDLINAKKAVLSAKELVETKKENEKYVSSVISVMISSMTLQYQSGEFEDCIADAHELLQYQKKFNSIERVFYAFFYQAFAYYQIGAHQEAIESFKKGIYYVLINDRPMDVYYLSAQDVFDALLNDNEMSPDIVREFKVKYQHPVC